MCLTCVGVCTCHSTHTKRSESNFVDSVQFYLRWVPETKLKLAGWHYKRFSDWAVCWPAS